MTDLPKIMRGEKGSVLLETILVIPLFIAFFSGILVLGELELGRSRLTAADRCALWFRACRLAGADDDSAGSEMSSAFFRDGAFADGTAIGGFRSQRNTAGWYGLFQGSAELKMELPVWASGTRKGGIVLLGDDGPDKNMWDNVSFRARETGGDPTHSVLARTDYEKREETPQKLSRTWYAEYATPYLSREGGLSDVPGSPGSVCPAEEFTRFPQFDTWSL